VSHNRLNTPYHNPISDPQNYFITIYISFILYIFSHQIKIKKNIFEIQGDKP